MRLEPATGIASEEEVQTILHSSETAQMSKTDRVGETFKVHLRSADGRRMDAAAGFRARSILHTDRAPAQCSADEPAVVEVLQRQAIALG